MDALEHDQIIELARIIAYAKGEKQAKYASILAMDEMFLQSENSLEILKFVANTEEIDQAKFVYEVIKHKLGFRPFDTNHIFGIHFTKELDDSEKSNLDEKFIQRKKQRIIETIRI